MSSLPPEPDRFIRPLQPSCMQHRAPARYEILDHKERRVPATLAGYRLKPGAEYQLRVETQEGDPHGWRLHLAPPPRFVEWPAADAPRGKARLLPLRTRSYLRDHWLQLLSSSAVDLSLKVEFDDVRQPYCFEIPVVLARRWLYAPLLLGGVLAAVPGPWRWEARAVLATGGVLAITVLCWLVDLIGCHRRARRLVAAVRQRSAIEEGNTTAVG